MIDDEEEEADAEDTEVADAVEEPVSTASEAEFQEAALALGLEAARRPYMPRLENTHRHFCSWLPDR